MLIHCPEIIFNENSLIINTDMKRLLYLFPVHTKSNKIHYDGVTKKILLEIETFKSFGFMVDMLAIENNGVFFKKEEGETYYLTAEERYYRMIAKVYNKLKYYIADTNYDYVYIRFVHKTMGQNRFLRKLKHFSPNVKIWAELPTFHRKYEPNSTIIQKISFVFQKIVDSILPCEVDYFVTFDNHYKLFGKPTIRVENFVNVNALPLKNNISTDGELHLLGVAQMTPSHGFDRVICGLADYYRYNANDIKVFFHIVGNGGIQKEWEKLSYKLGVSQYVVFEGIKSGQQLDELFNVCQIGVASLAIYRKLCFKASEIKIREYIARGLPFIYSAEEPDLVNQSFCLKVPHDESNIDINAVIAFYNRLSMNDVRFEMRQFAFANCTSEVQLAKIFPNI